MLRRDALSELVNLLRIRYTLSERVYFHHTKLSSGAMISKTVELALGSGFDPSELRTLRDDTLIWTLRQRFSDHPAIRHILGRLESRQLYKPCFLATLALGEAQQKELVERYHYGASEREAAEPTIAAGAGLDRPPGDRLLPVDRDVAARSGGAGPHGRRHDPGRCRVAATVRSAFLKEKHRALWKFLVLIDRSAWDRGQTGPCRGRGVSRYPVRRMNHPIDAIFFVCARAARGSWARPVLRRAAIVGSTRTAIV